LRDLNDKLAKRETGLLVRRDVQAEAAGSTTLLSVMPQTTGAGSVVAAKAGFLI
jgi:hypothetical protein